MMFEPITCYTELIEGLRDRVGKLGVRYQDFDELAGFPAGLSGKVFGPSQVKRLGPEKLFDAIRAAGLRLRIEEDPEQATKMRGHIAENFLPRDAKNARPGNFANPSDKLIDHVLRHLAGRKGGLHRLNLAVKLARSNAGKRSWERRREFQDDAMRLGGSVSETRAQALLPPPRTLSEATAA
jgi:hypothetical protein